MFPLQMKIKGGPSQAFTARDTGSKEVAGRTQTPAGFSLFRIDLRPRIGLQPAKIDEDKFARRVSFCRMRAQQNHNMSLILDTV